MDGVTEVPKDTSAYHNKINFDCLLLNSIDTSALYEEYSKEKQRLYRFDNEPDTEFYGAYKFYSNGHLNYFVLNRNEVLDSSSLNPRYTGYRGVYYIKSNKVLYDLFAEINGLGNIGKLSGNFIISNDTLYENGNQSSTRVFVKRKIPSLAIKNSW